MKQVETRKKQKKRNETSRNEMKQVETRIKQKKQVETR